MGRARKQQMEPAKSSSTIIERISRFSRRGSMFSTDHRPSVAFDSSVSFASSTNSTNELMKKVKKRKNYQNTFRLAPDEKPKIGEIRNDLQKSLDASCMDVEYHMIEPVRFSKSITQSMHMALKNLIPSRYRFTVQTILIEEADQDVSIGSKWLWNTETDTTLTIRHENQSMTAVVLVHLIYLE